MTAARATGRRSRLVPLVVVLAALFGAVLAQQAEVIGNVEGTVNGEPASWYLLEVATEEGPQATATWSSIMGVMYDVSLQAHPERSFAIEDTISISFSLFALPDGCPCSYGSDEVEVMYWTTSSMFQDFHSSADGGSVEATIDAFEEVAEGAYRLEGTLSAELPFVPGIGQEPDPSQGLTIEATFIVDRLAEVELDLP